MEEFDDLIKVLNILGIKQEIYTVDENYNIAKESKDISINSLVEEVMKKKQKWKD